MQVLSGRPLDAAATFTKYATIWSRYNAVPDIFDLSTNALIAYARDAPLRPEMLESAYHLFSATRDPLYLDFARQSLWALQNNSRTPCGYASIADVATGRLDDRMDSYFLAETLKYLFLIFDEVGARGCCNTKNYLCVIHICIYVCVFLNFLHSFIRGVP